VPEQAESLPMPAEKRCRLHDRQRLTPVEPAPEPDQGETGGIRGAPWRDMAFLIEGKLFAQKEVFCGERCGGMPTEPEEVGRIHQEHQQRAGQLPQMMEQVRASQHM
jgi:hypothetical protein